MGRLRTPLAIPALVGALVLAGCAGTKMPRYYVLTPLAVVKAAPYPDGPAIGVGPIAVARYLDRPEIVTRTGSSRLLVADMEQWGDTLGDEVTRALAPDMSDLLATDRVWLYPWNDAAAPGLQVTVDIVRFEREAGGAVTLAAFWSISDGETKRVLTSGRSTIVKTLDPAAKGAAGYEATVDLMSDALVSLGEDIAGAIEAMGPPRAAAAS